MWHDHPFRQRNKATKGACNGGRSLERGRTKFENEGVGNIGGSS